LVRKERKNGEKNTKEKEKYSTEPHPREPSFYKKGTTILMKRNKQDKTAVLCNFMKWYICG